MARSLYKGVFHDKITKRKITIKSRRSTISRIHLFCFFYVYNGKMYIKKKILPKMLGCKMGEFSKTRKS